MSYTANPNSARVAEMIDEAVVIPVLTVGDPASAVSLARALARGGLTVLEITLRTDTALAAIEAIAEALPEVTLGSGTVLSRDQLQASLDHGCRFAVSPGATSALLDAAEAVGLPLLPASANAGQAMALAERGYLRQKLFPAEPSGGVALLKSLGEPLPQIRFCPTGGIDVDQGTELPRAEERGLRRGLLGRSQGRRRGRRLGADRGAGVGGGGPGPPGVATYSPRTTARWRANAGVAISALQRSNRLTE